MANLRGLRQINGTFGKVWWDGELLAEIESFEAKVSLEREDVKFAGEMSTDSKIIGYKGEGTMKLKKMYSRVQKKIAQAIKNGQDIRSQIVAKLDDPDAFGTERVVLDNVWFNEVTLMAFELGQKLEEEIPFGFTEYDFPDLIEVQ